MPDTLANKTTLSPSITGLRVPTLFLAVLRMLCSISDQGDPGAVWHHGQAGAETVEILRAPQASVDHFQM
jgi:hypothetical protein